MAFFNNRTWSSALPLYRLLRCAFPLSDSSKSKKFIYFSFLKGQKVSHVSKRIMIIKCCELLLALKGNRIQGLLLKMLSDKVITKEDDL